MDQAPGGKPSNGYYTYFSVMLKLLPTLIGIIFLVRNTIFTIVIIPINVLAIASLIYVSKKTNKLNKMYEESGKMKNYNMRRSNLNKKIYQEIDFPPEPDSVDIMYMHYTMKNGQRRNDLMHYINTEYQICRRNDVFSFFDGNSRHDIPISDIKRIDKVKRTLAFTGWNKKVPSYSKEMKQYKIRETNLYYCVKFYYSMVIEVYGEECELMIMPYDLDIYRKLLCDNLYLFSYFE